MKQNVLNSKTRRINNYIGIPRNQVQELRTEKSQKN